MFLKQIAKDLFYKEIKEYWANEGCNSRMRKYNFIGKVLCILREILLLLTVIYFVYISSRAIVNIFDIRIMITVFDQLNIKEVELFIINIYQISFVLWVIFNLINYKIKSLSFNKTIRNIIIGLLGFPVIALIMFYFILSGYLMISFWILVVFLILDTVLVFLVNRIKYLYEVSIGKEKKENGK